MEDLRQNIPQPSDATSSQDVSVSNYCDSDLDLTVLETRENDILDACQLRQEDIPIKNKQQEQQPISSETATKTADKVEEIAKTANERVVNNRGQENALKKLLEKIRFQREAALGKNDQLSAAVDTCDSSSTVSSGRTQNQISRNLRLLLIN